MLVDPAFVQLTEVGFREDSAALGLVHSGAEREVRDPPHRRLQGAVVRA